MIKKVLSIFIALTLTTTLILGIAGCSPSETSSNQEQNSNTVAGDSDVSGNQVESSIVTISQEAADTLKDMISDGDYSEGVFLRVAPVRGGG